MDDDNEFGDGEIVWVKLSYCWWPGEVLAGERLTEEFLSSLKRRPLAVVKFFEEDSYEYVKNTNFIYKYNCSRKNEFLRKGLEQYRAKNKHMIKFPADVMQAERATGGDPNIVNSSDFLPQKRESYADIFSPNKSKGKTNVAANTPRSGKKAPSSSPSKNISVIPVRKHEVRILMQGSPSTGIGVSRGPESGATVPLALLTSTPRLAHNNSSLNSSIGTAASAGSVPTSPAQIYHCYKCGFESGRQNVIVLHTKHCRAVPMAPSNIPSVREIKPIQSPPAKANLMPKLVPVTPKPATPKPITAQHVEKVSEPDEEFVEVLQVVDTQPTPGRSGRTPRAAAVASANSTAKVDRRKKRGREKKTAEEAAPVVADINDGIEVLMEVGDQAHVPEEADVSVKTEEGKSLDGSTENNSSKGKADVELKNELLADWSEDEQDDQDIKEDKSPIKTEPVDETEKAIVVEATPPTVNTSETSVEKSVESSPQLASPASSGTTIKYRNIPKKQKREYIEVTNDQPALPVSSTSIEKSSSESSISTAATCGETLSLPDKVTTTSNESVPERPISAKQRILDRATRGSSSKSNSSDDLKQESPPAAEAKVAVESQSVPIDESKKEISCFDFKEEEEEEVVLNKSPRRSLSNKRDLPVDTAAETTKQEQEDQERAKRDAELKNKIDSLLDESAVLTLPELPKIPRAVSPTTSSSTETTPQQLKEEIDRNRTLPPKERGKRIFKTRNKIIENEAIALEQSKAMVLDFVKKSHEEELAELRQQQDVEKKLSSESPTTTNDDSQESVASIEPVVKSRFERSEFAAIKAKRTKLPQLTESASKAESTLESGSPQKPTELPEESTVSSTDESKPSEIDSLPVSISKDQIALDSLEKATESTSPGKSKGKKAKSPVVVSPIVLLERLAPEIVEPEHIEESTPKARKKRSSEMDNLDLSVLDIPRGRRGRTSKPEEPTEEMNRVEPSKESNESITPIVPEKNRKNKRSKKEEQTLDLEEQTQKSEISPPVEITQTPKSSKSKRAKHATQQRSADSTADLRSSETEQPVADIVVVDNEDSIATKKIEPVPEPEPTHTVVKQQPIKMIIKSKGSKSNSELICESVLATPEPKVEENREKILKSPKSSKRKKTLVEDIVEPTPEDDRLPVPVETTTKSLKSKRPKLKNEPPKSREVLASEPSATDLQIAEALIKLPEAATPSHKPLVVEQDSTDLQPTTSSPVPSVSTPKSINPRKRHLQTLLSNVTESAPQPVPTDNVTIPEKRKRDTIEVVSVAPATIVLDNTSVAKSINTSVPSIDDDKFDIDNIPIVMDDSELLEESTISTTTSSSSRRLLIPSKTVDATIENEDGVKLISTTKPMTKNIVFVNSSNGSTKIVRTKDEVAVAVPKKNLGIKSSTISIKPPMDQLSPSTIRSPAHSPPIRSAQLVQASSGGQIVITSKGTVLTTQSPTTSSAKTQLAAGSRTQLTHSSSSKACIVTSVVSSACTISSSTSKSQQESPTNSTVSHQRSSATSSAGSTPIKSPAKICVQSQEIIHPPTKPRHVSAKTQDSTVVQTVELSQKKHPASASPSQKKGLAKKHAEASTSSGERPLFSTSKGAPITSAESPGKKGHRVIKISPQKMKEFTRLGMVEDKGQGKVLTASGLKKFRQEQQQLQQQQQKQARSEKLSRGDSVDEEPSTSTPTPPPPTEVPAEVVIAAAADSSVKELPVVPAEAERSSEAMPESEDKQQTPESAGSEENEADAAVNEPEAESTSSNAVATADEATPPSEAVEPTESVPAPADVLPEATETSSNVQESSQLIAVPAENFGGPANLFYLCSVRDDGFVPVNNELLYLDASNQLVALPEQASVEDIVSQAEVLEISGGSDQAAMVAAHAVGDLEGAVEAGQQNILLNTQDGQQIILDQQSLMALAAGGDTSQLVTPDGQQILLQGSAQELLAALAVSQPGLGIVAAEGAQIIVAQESLIDLQDAPLPGEIIQVNPSTTVETNAILTKPPIMSTVEVPTKNGNGSADASRHSPDQKLLEPVASNLDESLAAVIGVQGNPNVPTSLELPITVTNPIIAKTTTGKINPIYQPATAISTIGIDPAAAVIDLPTVAQTGTDIHVDNNTHESSSSDDVKAESFEPRNGNEDDSKRSPEDFDEIIPNTPESQMNSHAEISSQFSEDELDESVPIPDVHDEEEDDNISNFSEVIPIQPNVVILRNVHNELVNNNENENSSDMELDRSNPGNEENTPNQPENPELTAFDSAANSAMVER